MHKKEKIIVNGMLLATAILWGSSYAFRKMSLETMGPFFFNGCRFFVGFLVAAILLSLESVFGGIFGALLLHERMNPLQILGCGLILTAVLISQLEKRAPGDGQGKPV